MSQVTARAFVGIDPGLTGAVAAITADGALLALEAIPTAPHGKTKRVCGRSLRQMLEGIGLDRVALAVIEQVASRPGQGAPSIFTFGRAYGSAEAILSALELPTDYVTPATWKRAFGLTGGTAGKAESVRKATDLFPALAGHRKGKGPTHDQAEAVLLAEYARRRWSGSS